LHSTGAGAEQEQIPDPDAVRGLMTINTTVPQLFHGG